MDQRTLDRAVAGARIVRLRHDAEELRHRHPAGTVQGRLAQGMEHALAMLEDLDAAAIVEAVGGERRARLAAAAELDGQPLTVWAVRVLEEAAAERLGVRLDDHGPSGVGSGGPGGDDHGREEERRDDE